MRARGTRRARRGTSRRLRISILAVVTLVAAATVIELWRVPPRWLLPVRRTDVRVLHWLDVHWLTAAGIAALGAVVTAIVTGLVPLFGSWLERRRTEKTPRQQARERKVMLSRVRRKIREPSLGHAARLALGLQTRPDILHIAMRVTRGPGRQPEPVPEGKPVLEVFDEASNSLLIQGAPGAGKTTLLRQLASALIDRAERDPDQPIPVVVNLESWASRRQPLDRWLAGELSDIRSYGVPWSTADEWIAEDELVLLLDGLDEVAEQHRAACAAAINDYREEHRWTGLVVSSRTRELQQLAVRLQLDEAVELQPLSDAQVSNFLSYLERTGTPLSEIRAAIGTDKTLREMLSTPLMLDVIALAYHGREPAALAARGSTDERQTMLWRAYVSRMFELHPLPPRCRYTPEQAVEWLERLAFQLEIDSQNEFRLDRLTSDMAAVKRPRLRLYPQALELHTAWVTEIEQDEIPSEDTEKTLFFRRLTETLMAALIAAAGTGLAAGLIGGPVTGLVSALATGLAALPLGSFFYLAADVEEEEWVRDRSRQDREPNDGIRHAVQRALAAGGIAFTVFGWIAGLCFWPVFGRGPAAGFGFSLGLWFGLWFAMTLGGLIALQHYIVRAKMARAGIAPRRYEAFLDAMAARLLLRRSGGSYQFTHRLLRDYLASIVVVRLNKTVIGGQTVLTWEAQRINIGTRPPGISS